MREYVWSLKQLLLHSQRRHLVVTVLPFPYSHLFAACNYMPFPVFGTYMLS